MERSTETTDYLATPASKDSEESLCGAILIDGGQLDTPVVAAVKATDFQTRRYGWLWSAFQSLAERGSGIDIATAQQEIDRNGKLDAFGGFSELSRLATVVPTAFNAPDYAATVIELAKRRTMKRYARAISMRADAVGKPVEEVLPRIVDALHTLQNSRGHSEINVYAAQAKTLVDAHAPGDKPLSLISGVIPAQSLTCWYGSPGSLKSLLAYDMCLSVATGSPWLPGLPNEATYPGWGVRQSPALIVDIDNGLWVVKERLAALARGHRAPNDTPLHWLTFPDPPLLAKQSLRGLIQFANSVEAGIIVIDTLLRISGVKDESSSEMDAVMMNLRILSEETGAAVQVLHHPRKSSGIGAREGDSIRGHSAIEAGIDTGLKVIRDGQSETISIKCTKARRVPVETFAALWTYDHESDGETLHSARMYRTENPDPQADKQIEIQVAIREVLKESPPLGKNELAANVGYRREAVFDAVNTMIRANQVSTVTGKRGKILCSLTQQ